MCQANVVGTENALGAALDAKVPRVVYISTIGAFGNTKGEVVDETYDHPGEGFTSYYEETKYEAHQVAKSLIADGLPCVMVQPGGVYGPDDHSAIGKQILDFAVGPDAVRRLPEGRDEHGPRRRRRDGRPARPRQGRDRRVLRPRRRDHDHARRHGHDREGHGQARAAGNIPTGLLKAVAPAGPVIGKIMGQPPNMREMISSADGVTFWASSDKAEAKLGYEPRPLDRGLRETLEAEGKL